jgi:adenine deaminase
MLRDAMWLSGFSPFRAEHQPYLPPRAPRAPNFWTKDSVLALAVFRHQLNIVGSMHRAGVPLLAGTDTPGTERVPGLSLAEELYLLVQAGLSPKAALQAATREPARFLGMEDSLGTIEPGKAADLVLLERDPLVDITNVRSVRSVVIRGRYLSAARLEAIRAAALTLVAELRDSLRAVSAGQFDSSPARPGRRQAAGS